MISAVILLASIVFATAFLAAWCSSPALRRSIEVPKFRFLARVRQYDAAQGRRRSDRRAR